MKKIFWILMLLAFTCAAPPLKAQSSSKGFDYSAHRQMNHKAARWSKRRMKASGGDQLNLKCSVRKSRRAARRNKG